MNRCRATARYVLVALLLSAPLLGAEESSVTTRAQRHFQRGVAFTQSGELEPALQEFQAAYALSPQPTLLYNIGRAQWILGRPVEAVEAFEGFLRHADNSTDLRRRAEIEELVHLLRGRIGVLQLDVQPAGTEVFIDGRSIGVSPFVDAVPLPAGSHGLVARREGAEPSFQSLTIDSRAPTRVVLRMEPRREPRAYGQLRLGCAVPDVEVAIDGVVRGRTPVLEPLLVESGQRKVRFARQGYRVTERSVTVPALEAISVSCDLVAVTQDLARLGPLRLSGVPSRALVRVDGVPYAGQLLPLGRHLVEVDAPGHESWRRMVTIGSSKGGAMMHVMTRPMGDRIPQSSGGAGSNQLAIIAGASGLVLVAGAVATYVWNSSRYSAWQSELRAHNAAAPGAMDADWRTRSSDLREDAVSLQRADDLALGLGAVGGLALTTGVVLWLTGQSSTPWTKMATR